MAAELTPVSQSEALKKNHCSASMPIAIISDDVHRLKDLDN